MTTRAEIEAEIARLQSMLQRTEIDPEFTPMELVRWDPSLIGTLLRIQHYKDIPANAFDKLLNDKYEDGKTQLNLQEHIKSREWFGRSRAGFYLNLGVNGLVEDPMIGHGVLTKGGCEINTGFNGWRNRSNPMIWGSTNQFEDVAIFKRVFRNATPYASRLLITDGSANHGLLPCSEYNLKIVKLMGFPTSLTEELHVPLADPDKSLLDQIFIATSTKIPGLDKEIIINNYPLSTLYKEWKADKDAGRTLRKTPLVEAHETIATLRKELQALKMDQDASLDKRDRLANALHIASNIICTTDPL